MPSTTRPLYVVQLAPDGRRHEVINRDTLELLGPPSYDRDVAQQRADALNAGA